MNFNAEVIELSFQKPVVVDFWAEWCGPCRVLGPVIEELAKEANGAWELYKLNTEEAPELAAEYKIRGIPAVKMFYRGQVVAEFTGALPKYQIEQWLAENLPDARSEELNNLLQEGDVQALRTFAENNRDLAEAQFELAKALTVHEPDEALKLFEALEADPKYLDKARDAKALAELMLCDRSEEAHPKVIDAINRAKEAYSQGNMPACLEALIEAVMLNKAYCNEMARRACIAIFHHLGEQHDISIKYRRRFNMALY
ncbi:thioredoxin [bacterium]|nr:thioredoxin [bacterium]